MSKENFNIFLYTAKDRWKERELVYGKKRNLIDIIATTIVIEQFFFFLYSTIHINTLPNQVIENQ